MKKRKKLMYFVGTTFLLLGTVGVSADQSLKGAPALNPERMKKSAQFDGALFKNPVPMADMGMAEMLPMLKQAIFDKQQPSSPEKSIPVIEITKKQLLDLPVNETHFFKLGHSSVLLWIEGSFWLFDPVFSERASPFSFMGPKRFHKTPITIEELPPIKGVILSHNHYDHLDKATIEKLKSKVEKFYTPLGLGADLVKWGVFIEKVRELDWHESVRVGEIEVRATPSQHFSGRSLSDRNETLWASWVVKSPRHAIYFSGDSGYFSRFKDIGQKYGPFDVSFIETGAYNKLWSDIHMDPKDSVQAFLDLRGGILVPIHNSTFDLALHTV